MNGVQESTPEVVLPRKLEDSYEEEGSGHLVIDTTEAPASSLIPMEPTIVDVIVKTAEHSKVAEPTSMAESCGTADLVNEVTCPSAVVSKVTTPTDLSLNSIPVAKDASLSTEPNETIKYHDTSPIDTSLKNSTISTFETDIKSVSESSVDFSPTQILRVLQSTPIQTTVTSSQMSLPILSGSSGVGSVGDVSGVLPPLDTASFYSSEDEDEYEEGGSLLGFGLDAGGGASSPSDASSLNATFSPGGSVVPRSSGSKSRRKSDRILPLPGDDGSDQFVCPVCREAMPSLHDFTKHIRQHNTVATISTINTCTICAKILSSQSSLDRHMLVHSGERPFQCRVCRMAFTTNGNMHRHMRIHEKDFPLPGEVSPNTQVKETNRSRGKKKYTQAMREIKLELSPTGELSVMNDTVSTSGGPPATGARKRKQKVNGSSPAKKRSKESGGGRVVVLKSNEFLGANVDVLASIPSVNNRMILEPVDIDLDAARKKCPVCSRLFFSKYGFTNHLYTHEKYRKSRLLLRCSQCNLGWTSLQQHESHMKNVHKAATDKDSREAGTSAAATVEEKPVPVETKKSKENKNVSQAAIQSLDLTSIDFTSDKFPIIAKVVSEKTKSKSSVDKSVDKSAAAKICKTCDKSFACTASLALHVTRHKPEAQTACDPCGRSFATAKLFKEHALMTHEKDDVIGGYSALVDDDENARFRKVVAKDEFMLVMGMKMTRAMHMKPTPVATPPQPPPTVTEELSSPIQTKVQLDANQNLVKTVVVTSTTESPKLLLPKTLADLKFHRVFPLGAEITPAVTSYASLEQLSAFGRFKFQLPQSIGDFQIAANALLSAQHSLLPPLTQGVKINNPRSFLGVLSSTPMVKSELDSTKSDSPSPPKLVAPDSAASGLDESRILPPTGVLTQDLNAVDFAGVADDSNESGNNLMMELDTPEKEDNSGPHACQYCDEVFYNYRTFKGHVRSHLSTSPYKCTQCSYCSTDKSTLIRHLRTHNGERPFQCLICEFAFTTKANCERHVRKKHLLENKDDIEVNIGYNRQMAESAVAVATVAAVEPPGVPALSETVCKYCGEDFKFFRALKHHVRSQTSCQHKPFLCKVCGIGFSTKANCIRHIQKQHPEVESGHSESHMQVKMELLDAQTRMRAEGTGRETDGARKSNEPRGRTAKRRLESPAKGAEVLDFPPLMLAVNPLISPQRPAHSHSLQMKQEYEDVDQPLDFSIKSHHRGEGTLNLSAWDKGGAGEMGVVQPIEITDQPMDLTVKPRESKLVFHHRESDLGRLFDRAPPSKISKSSAGSFSVNCAGVPMNLLAKRQIILSPPLSGALQVDAEAPASHSAEYNRYYIPTLGRLKCPDCPIQFKDGVKLLIHMRSHSSNSHQCRLCSTSFSTNAEFEKHIKLRHPEFYDFNARNLPSKEAFKNSSGLIYPEATNAVHLPIEQNNNNSTTLNANVRFMINDISVPPAAAAAVAVAAAATASSRASNSELEAVSKILEAAARSGNFPTFYPASSSKGDMQASAVLSGGEIKKEGGGSSAPPKKELITIDSLNQSMAQCFQLKVQEESMNRGSNFDLRDFDSANESGEQSLESMTKKKRNSYADSPHKLRCPYCPRAFPWISSLKRHILTHTGQKPFRCPQCTVTFSTKSNRERHMIRKHGLDVHDPATRQMMDRPYKCHLCVFSSFASSSKLIRHYRVKHPDQEIPDSLASNMASMSQEELNIALNNLGGVREEPRSGDNETGMHDYDDEDDEDDDDDSISEEQAEAERLTMEYLSTNSASRAPSPAPETSFNRTATPPQQLNKHSARSTPDFTAGGLGLGGGGGSDKLHHINPERDNYNVDKITECWKCWKTFDSRKTLLRHLKEHSIDLPFKCYLCDASFNVRLDSLKHKAVKHVSEWLAVQEKNKVGLLADYSELMDKVVEETLAGNVTRRVHEGIDLDIKPESDYAQRKVFCTLCPKRFWSLQDLRRHMRSHTGERPFECSICQARFTLKHSMMRHRRKHTDEPGADLHGGVSDEEEDSLHSNDHEGEVQFLPSILESSNGSGAPLRRLLPDVCLTTYKQRVDAPIKPATAETSAVNNETFVLNDVPHSLVNVSSISSFQSPSNILSAAPVCVQSDLLQNLLGITDVSTIDQMLDSPNEAATMLGIQKSKKD